MYSVNMVEFNKKILSNGMTVLHEKREVPVSTVMLATKYGGAHEPVKEKGMAHFIEHLCFKGTEKRSTKEIAESVEKVGGELNAFTHEEVTAYHVKLPSEHLEVAMDVLFDVFFNANFPESEIKKEANVICEEIKMYHDNPSAHTLEKIRAGLYEPPFGMFLAGSEENILGMTREQILERHRRVYAPDNAILCVVGDNNFEEVIEFAEKFCVERVAEKTSVQKIVQKYSTGEEKRENLQQANLALGFHFPFSAEKERYAAEVFSTLLGRGMSSKLFTEVREKRGLVYGIRSDVDFGGAYGYMIIWAGTDPEKTKEVLAVCLKEFKDMANISEKELEEAKIQVVGNHKVGSECSNDTAVDLILEEVSGDARDYYNYEKKVGVVGLKEIKKLAEKSDYSSFVLGP
jgi:predicted Zn-dependent peptidase